MTNYLHGARIIEKDDGPRPIQVVSSSVIGIVGTAPNAESAKAATVTIGSGLNGLVYTAKKTGNDGNTIKVEYIKPEASKTLSVDVSETIIKVTLATGADGVVTSTAATVKAAVEGKTEAAALVTLAFTKEAGTGVIDQIGVFYLAGGQDEPFPLNKPIAISAAELSKIKQLGDTGTLPWIMEIISRFGGHLCVLVRVAEGKDEAETATNIAGSSTTGKGIWALLDAQSATGFEPRILGAPGYSHVQTVANDLFTVAERCRGYAYADCAEAATETEAIQYRANFGAEFGMLLWPYVWVGANGQKIKRPLSAFALGLRAKTDNERGWHWTMSNQEITGILGTVTPVSFRLDDPNSTANRVNQNHITTVVNTGAGFVLWGCRSLATDTTKQFENWGRAKGIIYDSLIRAHQWAVDRNITSTYVEDVTEGVINFLSDLKAKGYILSGTCWADPELNSPSSIMLGKFYWNFDYAVPAPAEQLSFIAIPQNQQYFSEVV